MTSDLLTISPITYLIFLTICLIIYTGYLILPRGLRHYICGTKRRYRRQNPRHVIWKQSTLSSDYIDRLNTLPTNADNAKQYSPGNYWGVSAQYSIRSAPTYTGDRTFGRGDTWQSPLSEDTNNEIDSIGNNRSYLQTHLTQPPGIKVIAHGTKCNPRPVYITLHFYDALQHHVPPLEYQNCLTWRAELRKSNDEITMERLKLGNLRKVSFEDVLGVHRGKATTALRRMQTASLVDAGTCFSLLTKSGTLDLQCANVDNIPAGDVREHFIELLALALKLRGMILNESSFGNAGLASPGTLSSHNPEGNSNGRYPVRSTDVSTDANLSVISF
jgi:hypothetical protein